VPPGFHLEILEMAKWQKTELQKIAETDDLHWQHPASALLQYSTTPLAGVKCGIQTSANL
jgi:hypothetical protein